MNPDFLNMKESAEEAEFEDTSESVEIKQAEQSFDSLMRVPITKVLSAKAIERRVAKRKAQRRARRASR